MDNILAGFTKEITCMGTYWYKHLKNGDCLEIVKKKNYLEVNYIGNRIAKLTEFSNRVDLIFFKSYIDNLLVAFGV